MRLPLTIDVDVQIIEGRFDRLVCATTRTEDRSDSFLFVLFFEFPIFSVINSYLDIQEKCLKVESWCALMSMSIPINGVSRDDVQVKVDGIAPQQQEIEGGKIGWLGKRGRMSVGQVL